MIKALLVDDEPAANRSLSGMLERGHPGIDIVGQAESVADALRKIDTHKPELLFLDINLPDGTGFDVVRRLRDDARPEVIFVTSEENHAMQAIKVAALGYLVKPVSATELLASIELAKVRIRQRNSEQRLHALMSNMEQSSNASKQIGIPSEKGVEFVQSGEIVYCEGVDGYTSILLDDGSKRLSSYSIGEYRKMLEHYGFFAVHRSYLVNRMHVRGWADMGHLRLKNNIEIGVSRRRKAAVDKWLTS